jgi:hypothetical protein
MIKKFVYLDKNNEVLATFKYDDENIVQAALVAAYTSNPKFVEVDIHNKATLGWYFDGEDYVQYPV